MKKLLSLLLLVHSLPLFAADFKSANAVHANFSNKDKALVTVEIGDGFHLNQEAPNQVLVQKRVIKANTIREKFASFAIDPIQASDSITLNAYVCDDALTSCESRTWTWDATGKLLQGTPAKVDAMENSLPITQHGFIQDSLPTAIDQCKKTRLPIMLLFSARWCPGCMRMEQEIWTNPKYQGTLALFTKVKLDADRFKNKPMMEKYGVAGIPTTLILNCDGEELERYVDYQEPHGFQQALKLVAKNKELLTRTQLEKRASLGEESSELLLARRAALSGDNATALKWYSFIPEKKSEAFYWWALVDDSSRRQDKTPSAENKKQLLENLQGAIAAFPETPTTLDWRSQLAELQGAETKESIVTLDGTIKLCDQLIQDPDHMKRFNGAEPAGDYLGIESLKVYQAKAEALSAEKKMEEARLAWAAAVKEGNRLGIKDEPSGKFFRYLTILKSAGEKDRVDHFFKKFLAITPRDPELLRRYGKFLYDQGNYKEAAARAFSSLAYSYDQNEVFAATLYAKAVAKDGNPKRAKDFLLRYLDRADISSRSREEISDTLSKL